MDTATEAALTAILQALIEQSRTADLPDALTQSLYGKFEELKAAHMPAEAASVGRLADAARDIRNAYLNRR